MSLLKKLNDVVKKPRCNLRSLPKLQSDLKESLVVYNLNFLEN